MKQKRPSPKIDHHHFRVTIFGSARIKKNDLQYKLVYELAHMLAQEGIDIVTGGGPGIMGAASRGHHSGRKNNERKMGSIQHKPLSKITRNNNAHIVGLTINLPKEQRKSYHLDIRKDFDKFSKRLDQFMRLSNIVVAAPGGLGTTLELFYTWQLMQVKHICDMPIILLGSMWKPLLKWIRQEMLRKHLINPEDLKPIFLAKSCREALQIIKQARKEYEAGGKNVCRNMKKYV